MPAHPDPDDVTILAVCRDQFFEIGGVDPLDPPAVNLAGIPQMPVPPETFAERPRIMRRVAKGEEDDLGLRIRQRTERDLPHFRRDARGLIEDQDDALALVVQPGERLCIGDGPGDEISAPPPLMPGRGGDERGRVRAEPVLCQREIVPFRDLGRRLGEQLAFGIGGDDDAGIDAGIEPPFHQHRDQRRFADAMPRGARDAAGREARGRISEMRLDRPHHLALPGARATDIAQHAFAPGKGEAGIAKGIVTAFHHAIDQALAGGGLIHGAATADAP